VAVEYRQLGRCGLRVSALGLGGSTFGRQCDAALTARVVGRALDLGINFVDTADVYADGLSETYLGRAVRDRRREVVLATKVGGPTSAAPNGRGLSRAHIMNAVEDSLRRLDTDVIDLYQCHLPDEDTPIEETLRALEDLVRQGKVRYVGCSNFAAWQVCAAVWTADLRALTPLVSVQPRYNMLDRTIETELLPLCRQYGIGVIPYHPLAAGILTGKYRAGEPPPAGTRFAGAPALQEQLTEERLAVVTRLDGWARDHGHRVAELAFAWLRSRPEVSTIIAGATSVAQVEANVAAQDWQLTPAEVQEIEALV
jgi:aryl-alcohol dehydrogenase-like predicted oxidoreductase